MAMNIKKGLDRIALAISLITLFPGFYLNGEFFYARQKTESPEFRSEHQRWQSRYDERKVEFEVEAKALSESELIAKTNKILPQRPLLLVDLQRTIEYRRVLYVDARLAEVRAKEPGIRFIYPSRLKVAFVAAACAALQSFFLLILLMGLIRSAIWIARGFKD